MSTSRTPTRKASSTTPLEHYVVESSSLPLSLSSSPLRHSPNCGAMIIPEPQQHLPHPTSKMVLHIKATASSSSSSSASSSSSCSSRLPMARDDSPFAHHDAIGDDDHHHTPRRRRRPSDAAFHRITVETTSSPPGGCEGAGTGEKDNDHHHNNNNNNNIDWEHSDNLHQQATRNEGEETTFEAILLQPIRSNYDDEDDSIDRNNESNFMANDGVPQVEHMSERSNMSEPSDQPEDDDENDDINRQDQERKFVQTMELIREQFLDALEETFDNNVPVAERQQQYPNDDHHVQDAVAASSALVGENVLDSPGELAMDGPLSKRVVQTPFNSPTEPFKVRANSQSSCGEPTTVNNNIIQHRSIATENNADPEALSVGLMAQSLDWVRKQRERRQRLYLQNQAEQQLRKIRQAQRAEKAAEAAAKQQHANANRSLLDNPTFQNMMMNATTSFVRSSSDSHSSKLNNNNNNGSSESSPSSTYRRRRWYGESCGEAYSDSDDYDVTKVAVVSKSGDGYSVKLSIDSTDDDDDDAVDGDGRRRHRRHYRRRGNNGGRSEFDDDDDDHNLDAGFVPPVRVEDERRETEQNPFILSRDLMQQIAIMVLPRGIAYCRWKRLYSLARDGDSFDACLNRIHGYNRTLLVIRTSKNAILGGFADAPWDPAGGACYYGGSNTCLFRVVSATTAPTTTTTSTIGGKGGNHNNNNNSEKAKMATATRNTLHVYKWTGANRYIQLCDAAHTMLAFGGGGSDGAFGLCIEQDFQRGSTGPCATFDNEPLCEEENFSVVDMEIFGFLVGQF